jgi:hypothetical protein
LHLGIAAGSVVVIGIIQLAEQGLAWLIVPGKDQILIEALSLFHDGVSKLRMAL